MVHGQSSQRGILFADDALPGDNAVYCCYEAGEIICLTGPLGELRALFKSEMDADKVPGAGRRRDRCMLASIGFMAALVAAAFMLGAPLEVRAGAVAFALIGAFPLMALASCGCHEFGDDRTFAQLKRNHGAEHMAIAYHRRQKRKGGNWSLEEIGACSHIDPECGTVYMASALLWAGVVGAAICAVGVLGIGGVLGLAAGAAVLLALNTWFNPANPLKLVQLRMVARPGTRELMLARAGMLAFIQLAKRA